MAEKTFGYVNTVNYSRWGGVPYYANVGLRAVMPEDGTVLKIALKLARVNSSDSPIVWGTIWDRDTGNIIAVSAASQTPTNTWTGSYSSLQTFTFDLPETKIAAGKALWIGYAKRSNESNRALYFGLRDGATGYTTDHQDVSRSTPGSFSAVTASLTSEALWVEVTYKTGGQIKVWTGAAQAAKPVKVWNGSSWVEKPVKVWNGSSWEESNS